VGVNKKGVYKIYSIQKQGVSDPEHSQPKGVRQQIRNWVQIRSVLNWEGVLKQKGVNQGLGVLTVLVGSLLMKFCPTSTDFWQPSH
jgi:hypothetical protein